VSTGVICEVYPVYTSGVTHRRHSGTVSTAFRATAYNLTYFFTLRWVFLTWIITTFNWDGWRHDTRLTIQDNPESRYQNIFILDFFGAKDDGSGGDNWSYKTRKAPCSQTVTANKLTPRFLHAECSSCRPTNSVRALNGKLPHSMDLLTTQAHLPKFLRPPYAPGYLGKRLPILSSDASNCDGSYWNNARC